MKKKIIFAVLGILVLAGLSVGGYYSYQRHQIGRLYKQATDAYRQKNYQHALVLYQNILLSGHENMSLQPDDWAEICSRLAYAYYKVKPDGDGNNCLEKILPLYNSSNLQDTIVRGYIYFCLGRFSFNQKKWIISSENYRNAIKNLTPIFFQPSVKKHLSEPLLCSSYRELLSCYFELKQYSEAQKLLPAIEHLDIENSKFPEWAGIYSGLAASALASGSLNSAKTYCQKGLKLYSALPETQESRVIFGVLKWIQAKINYREKMLSQAIQTGRQAYEILKSGTYNSSSPEILKTIEEWEQERSISSHK